MARYSSLSIVTQFSHYYKNYGLLAAKVTVE